MTVSIVILNWNGEHYLRKFLPTLVENSRDVDAEIVVADNASTDNSLTYIEKEHPDLRVIRLNKNHGYTGGYNRALAELDSRYFLLLNSDIEVPPKWLQPLLDFMEKHPDCAACAPKILAYDNRREFEYAGASGGFIDRYGYPFCRGRIFDHLEADQGQYDEPAKVFWASGACLMIRANMFREAGGLDEQFFAHMEEIDLCWRLQRKGYSIACVPGSQVYHVGGGTLERGNPWKTYLNFRNNLLLLYKNLSPEKRGRILFIRKVLDAVSFFKFLFSGSIKDAWAVWRAHLGYYGMKKRYKGMGDERKTGENYDLSGSIYPRSIVVDFFLKGRKKFDDLNWKQEDQKTR